MAQEELLLMLRTKWGVRRELFGELGVPADKVAREIAAGNLELIDADTVGVTERGRLLVDGLVLNFLSH